MNLEKFTKILSQGKILDLRHHVRGCAVWPPFGMQLKRSFLNKSGMFARKLGYSEVEIPLLIPEHLLQKQKTIKSFEGGVLWVTKTGKKELEEKLYLKPSGEMPLYSTVKKWIKSYRDLPLKVFLVSPYFRHHKKKVIPLIIGQGSTMIEGHAFFRDEKEALAELKEIISALKSFLSDLGLNFVVSKRPKGGNLPVCDFCIGFDTLLPFGKTIQLASIYMQGKIYSDLLGIRYTNEKGIAKSVNQIEWGFSERVLGSLIAISSDEKGLVLSPSLSPIQAVIIPILKKGSEKILHAKAFDIVKELQREGIRAKLDNSEEEIGKKFEHWEKQGIPLRVEIGLREIKKGKIVFFRRDLNKKVEISEKRFLVEVKKMLDLVEKNIKSKNNAFFEQNTQEAKNFVELGNVVKGGKLAMIGWCGKESCRQQIEKKVKGEILGVAVDGKLSETLSRLRCLFCESAGKKAFFASRI